MVLVVLAGGAAGTINTIVGSGSLISFPTLVALGVPPVVANVSNNIGLVPGSISGAIGYRRELAGQWPLIKRLAPASLIGSIGGALLLLVLPESAFDAIVPALIAIALVLVILQPRLSRRLADRPVEPSGLVHVPVWVAIAVLFTGVYGGYFGAAQGVLLMALLGIGVHQSLQHNNALKNVLAAVVNVVASVVFVIGFEVDWVIVGLIAGGAVVGGQIGATVGRRLSPTVLRAVIVLVGTVALVGLLVRLF